MTASHVNDAPTIKFSTPVILIFFSLLAAGGHALEDLFLSLSYQGVEMLAELWLDNLYVYQAIITPEIGNCPPLVDTRLLAEVLSNAVSLQIIIILTSRHVPLFLISWG